MSYQNLDDYYTNYFTNQRRVPMTDDKKKIPVLTESEVQRLFIRADDELWQKPPDKWYVTAWKWVASWLR